MKTNRIEFRGCGLAILALVLGGCATLNESECRSADWQTIGLEDGGKGLPVTTVGRHRKACADYGVKPDLAAYRRGHEAGVVSFCTPRNGFIRGKAGRSHYDVCPPDLRDGFLAGYEDGRELYELERERDQVRRNLRTAEENLEDTQERLERREARLVADGVSSEEREQLLAEIKAEMARSGRLLTQIDGLESELLRLGDIYDTLSAQYRY